MNAQWTSSSTGQSNPTVALELSGRTNPTMAVEPRNQAEEEVKPHGVGRGEASIWDGHSREETSCPSTGSRFCALDFTDMPISHRVGTSSWARTELWIRAHARMRASPPPLLCADPPRRLESHARRATTRQLWVMGALVRELRQRGEGTTGWDLGWGCTAGLDGDALAIAGAMPVNFSGL